MTTVRDVIKYCEERSGVRTVVGGLFAPCGGGLYGLEQSAYKTGHHELAYMYRQQRTELQLVMYELSKVDQNE